MNWLDEIEENQLPAAVIVLRENLRTELKKLDEIKYDFSEDSQQRWAIQLGKVSQAKDDCWYLQVKLDRI